MSISTTSPGVRQIPQQSAHLPLSAILMDPLTNQIHSLIPKTTQDQNGRIPQGDSSQSVENFNSTHMNQEESLLDQPKNHLLEHEIQIENLDSLGSSKETAIKDTEGDTDTLAPIVDPTIQESLSLGARIQEKPIKQSQMMRFCPSLSTGKFDISPSGLTARSKQSGKVVIATNVVLSRGCHFWEIHCPIKCQQIEIGVSSKSANSKPAQVTATFRTTTPRTIGVKLDVNARKLNFWIDGRPVDKMSRTLPLNQAWTPIVVIHELDLEVILNPLNFNLSTSFMNGLIPRQAKELYEDADTGCQYSFSACLGQPISNIEDVILNLLLGRFLIANYTVSKLKSEIMSPDQVRQNLILLASQGVPEEQKEQGSSQRIDHSDIPLKKKEDEEIKRENLREIFRVPDFEIDLFEIQVSRDQPNEEVKEQEKQEMVTQCAILAFKDSQEALRFLTLVLKQESPITFIASEDFPTILRKEIDVSDNKKLIDKFIGSNFLDNDTKSLLSHYTNLQYLPKVEDIDQIQTIISRSRISKAQGSCNSELKVEYLPFSDQAVFWKGDKLKLVARNSKGHEEFFQSPSSVNFENHQLYDILEQVILQTDRKGLNEVIEALKIEDPPSYFNIFQREVANSKSLSSIKVTFLDAYFSLQILLAKTTETIIKAESGARKAEKESIVHKEGSVKSVAQIFRLNQYLSLLVDLEEQLYQKISRSADLTHRTKVFLKSFYSLRSHTALGRVGSLTSIPSNSQLSPISLAENGMVNVQDKQISQGMRFFQHAHVDLISTEGLKGYSSESLRAQFPHSLFFQGHKTWNVSLSNQINFMPVQHHTSTNERNSWLSPIDTVLGLPTTDLTLSVSAKDGTVNIWSTLTGLKKLHSLNFKQQFFVDPKDDFGKADLYFHNFDKKNLEHSVIFSKDKLHQQKQFQDNVETAGCLMWEMFDEREFILQSEDSNQSEDGAITSTSLNDLNCLREEMENLDDQFSAEEVSAKLREFIKQQKPVHKGGELVEIGDFADLKTPRNDSYSSYDSDSNSPKTQKKEEKQKINPQPEMVTQLKDMGFNEDLAKQALIKISNSSIAAALDEIMKLQEIQVNKDQSKGVMKQTLKNWKCPACTLENEAKTTNCSLCGSLPSEQAFQEQINEEDKKKQEEEGEKLEQQKKQQEQKQRNEEQEKQRKQVIAKKVNLQFKQVQKYYQNSLINHFILATFNSAKDRAPIVVGQVFQYSPLSAVDIHLKQLIYSNKYLETFVRKDDLFINKFTEIGYRNEQECLDSLFSGFHQQVESIFPSLQLYQGEVFKSKDLGVIRLKLKHLDYFCQLTTNFTSSGDPLLFLTSGRTNDQERKTFLVIIQHVQGKKKHLEMNVLLLPQDFLKDDSENQHLSLELVKDVRFGGENRVIVETIDGELRLYSFQFDRQSKESQWTLVSNLGPIVKGAKEYSVRNNQILVKFDDHLTVIPLQDKVLVEKEDMKSENSVLIEQIDPDSITKQDIQDYQQILKGKCVEAVSNSNGLFDYSDSSASQRINGRQFQKIHDWVFNSPQETSCLQLQFKDFQNLTKVQVDLLFECPDTTRIKELANQRPVPQNVSSLIDDQIVQPEPSSSIDRMDNLLGPFSVKLPSGNHQNEDQQVDNLLQGGESQINSFLPLIVQKHKGAQLSNEHYVNTIVFDNNQVFATNYSRPEFIFRHIHGHYMLLDKLIIRSQEQMKCGAYPIGRGLIFLGNSMADFEATRPLFNFTADEFQAWKEKGRKIEGVEVIYFDMDEACSLTLEVETKRPFRFILLKPTGFRTKPHHFKQNVNELPIEIEFFGAQGHTMQNISAELSPVVKGQNERIPSDYFLQMVHPETEEVLLEMLVDLEALYLRDYPLSLNQVKSLSDDTCLMARTSLTIQDNRISQINLKGIKLVLKRQGLNILRGATVIGFVCQAQRIDPSLRPKLTDPCHFSSVNQKLVEIVCNPEKDIELRGSILCYLTRLIETNFEFTKLILLSLDLDRFIKASILINDEAYIQASVQFLGRFQNEKKFIKDLYDILLDQLTNDLVFSIPHQKGFETIIGLLNWVMPLDSERSVQVLLKCLYSTLAKECLASVQSDEYVSFRTRYAELLKTKGHSDYSHHFPLDEHLLKPISQETQNSPLVTKKPSISLINPSKFDIIRGVIVNEHRWSMLSIYEASFIQERSVKHAQLFFHESTSKLYHFSLSVEDSVSKKLIFHQSFTESDYARLQKQSRPGKSGKDQKDISQTDSIWIPLGVITKHLTITIKYQKSSSSSSGQTEELSPQCIIEFFDENRDQTSVAELEEFKKSQIKKHLMKEAEINFILKCDGSSKMVCTPLSGSVKKYEAFQIPYIQPEDQESSPKHPSQPSQSKVQSGENSLQSLREAQNQLRGIFKNPQVQSTNKSILQNKDQVIDLLDRIQDLQSQVHLERQSSPQSPSPAPGLQYWTNLSVQISILLNSILVKSSQSEHIKKQVNLILAAQESEDSHPLVQSCFVLFKRFVVFERGITRQVILSLVRDLVWMNMGANERQELFSRLMLEFLHKPSLLFSQKQVIEALDLFNFPSSQLIAYMSRSLNLSHQISSKSGQVQSLKIEGNPLIMVSSILILCIKRFQREAKVAKDEIDQQQKDLNSGKTSQPPTQKKGKKSKKTKAEPTVVQQTGFDLKETESEDLDEELEQLGVQRSLSMPISGKSKTPQSASKQKASAKFEELVAQKGILDDLSQSMDKDSQLVEVFKLAVWICRQSDDKLPHQDKASLLLHSLNAINYLVKMAQTIQPIIDIIQTGQADFLELCVALFCFGETTLLVELEAFMQGIAHPHSITRTLMMLDKVSKEGKKEDKAVTFPTEVYELERQIQRMKSKHKDCLRGWRFQTQRTLIWLTQIQKQGKPGMKLAEAKAGSSLARWLDLLLEKCKQNSQSWLDILIFTLNSYIGFSNSLREAEDSLSDDGKAKKNQVSELVEKEDQELLPITLSKSLSLPVKTPNSSGSQISSPQTDLSIELIKSLMGLLNEAKPTQGSSLIDETEEIVRGEQSYLQIQLWSLTLKSLPTIEVDQLMESQVLQGMISLFLRADSEIQQNAFPEILKISDGWLTSEKHQSQNAQMVLELLFTCINHLTENKQSESVVYSLAQGWVDIMIAGSAGRQAPQDQQEKVTIQLDPLQASQLLQRVSEFLWRHLNYGSFEGPSGANESVIMRLNLMSDLLLIAVQSKAPTPAIVEAEKQIETNQQIGESLKKAIDHLMGWLFLNSRTQQDEQVTTSMGNVAPNTPATEQVRKMTDMIENFLQDLGKKSGCDDSVKYAFQSLIRVVKQLNSSLSSAAENSQMGADILLNLSKRTNLYFTKLVSQWMISDSIANHFVFQLDGFEFLLDIIGKKSSKTEESTSTAQNNPKKITEDAPSDLYDILFVPEPDIPVSQPTETVPTVEGTEATQIDSEHNKAQSATKSESEKGDQVGFEAPELNLNELGNKFLIFKDDNSGTNGATTHSKIDWSCNKRAYKNRLMVTSLQGHLRNEYWVLFKLQQTSLLKEIQIAFTNYWSTDAEAYAAPLTVFVQAGLDKENLTTVCSLDLVKDDGFGSVQATVFGKNMHTFRTQTGGDGQTIEEVIESKLKSVKNFQVNFIKFSMRRHLVLCIENSPICARQTKRPAFAINYISILGYKVSDGVDRLAQKCENFVHSEQKKTALQVLSKLCSGNFQSVLRIISNQHKTIEKIKSQFDLLSSLSSIKSSLIEPTFITIARFNTEMGDWMVRKFLDSASFEKHAPLTANLILCEISQIPDRIQMLLDFLVSKLEEIDQTKVSDILPAIQVLVQTVRLSAPLLTSFKKIDLGVQTQLLRKIVRLIVTKPADLLNFKDNRTILRFVILLLCPPSPFTNSLIDPVEFAIELITAENSPYQKSEQIVASALALSRSEIAHFILDQKTLLSTLTTLPDQMGDFDQWILDLEHALQFWSSLSRVESVRKQLQELELPFSLYKMLRGQQCSLIPEQRSILKSESSAVGKTVELIKNLVAGERYLEERLADMMIDDLERLSDKRDIEFVNKVFIPLVKIEKTIPLTFSPARKQGPEFERFGLLSSAEQIQKEKTVKIPLSTDEFVDSSLLRPDEKKSLRKALEKVIKSKKSEQVLNEYLSNSWSKILEWSITNDHSSFLGMELWQKLQGKGPCLIIMVCDDISTKTNRTVYGAFFQGKVPSMENLVLHEHQETSYDVEVELGDFCFCYSQTHRHFTSVDGLPLAQIVALDEKTMGLTIGGSFLTLSFCAEFESCFGYLDEVEEFDIQTQEGFGYPLPDMVRMTNVEIWTLAQKEQIQTSLQPVERLTSLNNESKHPWISQSCSLGLYRPYPVYQVPSHISVETLLKILLMREGDGGISVDNVTSKENLENSKTVQEVYDQVLKVKEIQEEANQVLDLYFDSEKLKQTKPWRHMFSQEGSDSSDNLTLDQISALYIPQMSFFSQFESKGGVAKIINVTLSSLKMWTRQDLGESWKTWLQELYSFSQIPLFFQMFLKNQKCKDLLFKILAGLPDSDTSEDEARKVYWEKEQLEAVQINYNILSEVFSVSNEGQIRQKAFESGLLPMILHRLTLVSGEKPRKLNIEIKEDSIETPEKLASDQNKSDEPSSAKNESTKNGDKKKKKGVGYSSKQGQTFDVNAYLENSKKKNEHIKTLIDILASLFGSSEWSAPKEVADLILQSSFLPLLEQAFRNGSWLDMAKSAEVYWSYFQLAQSIAKQPNLLKCLEKIDECYIPPQKDSISDLLGNLKNLAEIFLGCLNQQQQKEQNEGAERPEKLARDVIETHRMVKEALEEHHREETEEANIEAALSLPVPEQYRILLRNLRFDYMDMKEKGGSGYNHHFKTLASQNESPPASKMLRLAQELADLSNALPCEYTNSIFVRVDKQRVDMMKALIVGATGTPYAHGCYEFDIFCDNKYPNESPKMNLMTTGGGSVRFNPNLYSCGKVCLSLLGTWRGNATENWDPKLSTILQVLLSVQAIIMSEDVYFNEPGFENEVGTKEGDKKNEGYSNIVRYANVKYAMLGQIKTPTPGFESVIKRHFYVKKAEILKDVHEWVELASKNEAAYTGLVHDHNYVWCTQFKQTNTKYREMLEETVKQLEDELNKLERPHDIQQHLGQTKKKQKQGQKKIGSIKDGQEELENIDVADDDQIDSTQVNQKEMNVEDDAVKDRWSRYIGAMGAEAVSKQAAASVFLSGAGALGIEIAKNLVLSGCKSFTLHDPKPASQTDLSGQFFINEDKDLGTEGQPAKSRAEASLPRLQQLNFYVRCKEAPRIPLPVKEEADLENEPWNLQNYNVVILTESDFETSAIVNKFCRSRGIKFISADCFGAFSRIFNDFGDQFEVLDKNGEETQDVLIKSITNEENGLVELIQGQKHKLEDGDEVLIQEVDGMKVKEGENSETKLDSINGSIHKVKVINPQSFRILSDTSKLEPYVSGGVAKHLKTKVKFSFKDFSQTYTNLDSENVPLDPNLAISDFEKMDHNLISHICFLTLDRFRISNQGRLPKPWDLEDAIKFVEMAKEEGKKTDLKSQMEDEKSKSVTTFYKFAFQCQGVLSPLCAFVGGVVSQECLKAITQKFSPIHQIFYYDALELLPEFNPMSDIPQLESSKERADKFETEFVRKFILDGDKSRSEGLKIVLGKKVVETLAYTKLFMVGAGAIGCELLKLYAMLGVGSGKKSDSKEAGSIVLTDPDVIEVSNLNRQFLFREKHLRKPKSSTAAAAAIQMNKDLKGNIVARLDKVHDGTSHIFTDQFFSSLSVVTNALDNVAARKYVDQRCVTAKTPLIESGTLGPKGHVQVILPFLTESYGSQKDPEDNNEIPHCTLKMFPEETLHCVEWARDLFGQLFSQWPKSALKIIEEGEKVSLTSQQDVQAFKEGLRILKLRPTDFEGCVAWARQEFEKYFNHNLKQLLHVYPLDAKTKDGNLFWSLPKRPPHPLEFSVLDPLHLQSLTSLACLFANINKIPIPSQNPRSETFRAFVGEMASKVKVSDFIPDQSAAQEIQASVEKQDAKAEEGKEEEVKFGDELDHLREEFIKILQNIPEPHDLKSLEKFYLQAEEFEKDVDGNFHIDFVHGMANCRSQSYNLEPMEWIQVKIKAGRIVPAMATTTASIAGLQALELVKLAKGVKKDLHRNAFLNLAVPIMQASEPGDVMKTKLTDQITTTLWDVWEIEGDQLSLAEIIKKVESGHEGLEVKDVLRGNTPIYFHAIMETAGKEQERDQLLQSKLLSLLELEKDELERDKQGRRYVEITVTCARKGDDQGHIIEGVPPVRVLFS